MTFASPAWLLLSLFAGLIAFLHSRPRRDVEVGSLFLWRRLELAVPPKATSRLPVPNLLLFLQILALLLIAVALARPVRGDGEPPVDHWIVLLDASASMDARAGGTSAFDAATAYVDARLRNAGRPPRRVSVVSVGAGPVVEAARLRRPESVLAAVGAVRPAHTGADWTAVPAVLEGLTFAGERTRVTVLTDGPGRAAAESVLEPAAGGLDGVGSAEAAIGQGGAAGGGNAGNATPGSVPDAPGGADAAPPAGGAGSSPGGPDPAASGPQAYDVEVFAFGAPAANLALTAVEPTLLDAATGLWRITGEVRRFDPAGAGAGERVTVRVLFEPAGGSTDPTGAGAAPGAGGASADPAATAGPADAAAPSAGQAAGDRAVPGGDPRYPAAGPEGGLAAGSTGAAGDETVATADPAEWTSFEVELDAAGIGVFDQTVALPGAGVLEVRLPDDGLAHDGAARFVVRDAPRTARVLYVGPGDRDLELALNAVPGVTVTRAPSLRPGMADRYDLVLLDGASAAGPTGTHTVRIGAADSSAPAIPDPTPADWREHHPLSGSVDWGALGIREARELSPLPGAETVVEATGGHPLVQARTTAAGREVVLAFRIQDTDWPDQPGFPAFVSNLVLWAVPDLGLAVEPPCRAGAPCPLGPRRPTADWRLRSPDGAEIPLPVAPAIGGTAAGAETDASATESAPPVAALAADLASTFTPRRSGVYRIVSSEGGTRPIAVNAAVAAEADLTRPDAADAAGDGAAPAGGSAWPPVHRWLLVLALVALLAEAWIAARRGERFLRPEALRSGNPLASRWRAVLGFRLAAIALLVLAIVDPRVPVPTRETDAVLVVDGAAAPETREAAADFAAGAADAAGRNRRLGSVRVGATGRVAADLGSASAAAAALPTAGTDAAGSATRSSGAPPAQPEPLDPAADPTAADLEAAVRLAAALLPRETTGRIAVVGDGIETRGSVAEALPEILARGIPVDVVLPPASASTDVAVASLTVPGDLRPNERASLRAVIHASVATTASLRLVRDGTVLEERAVDLRPGRNRVDFEVSEEETGEFLYEVEVAGTGTSDSRPENDRNGTVVAVREPPRIAIVTPQPAWGSGFADALEVQGIAAEVFPPSLAPTSAAGAGPSLGDFDALALMNVPAADLPDGRAAEIEAWVREAGGGLVLMGGENTFGPGGYYDSPLEAVSPLSAKIPQELPNLAIIFVLDRSGSMGESVGQGTRLDIARVATLEAIDLLDPETQVGVVAFDLNAYPVVPLQRAGDREAIREQIERMETGGGTRIYAGLALAFVELSRVDPEWRRHIVLMSDGQSQSGNYPVLMGLIADRGITVSTAAIGAGADFRLMEELARRGSGAAHATTDFNELPSILAREASRFSSSPVREESIEPSRTEGEPGEATPFAGGPDALGGFVRTTAKPGARVHLEAGEDTPLLASWRYGLGRVVGFASQGAGAWSAEWMESPGYSSWWAQTVRWALPPARAGLTVRVSRDRDYGRIVAELVGGTADGEPGVALRATVRAPDGSVLPARRLAERSPGVYETAFIADRPGTYGIRVDALDAPAAGFEPVERTLHVGYPGRAAPSDGNADLLRALAAATGGRVLETGRDLFETDTPLRWLGQSIWSALALIALAAFLLELLGRYTGILRRLSKV